MNKRQGLFCLVLVILFGLGFPVYSFAKKSNDPNVKQWSYKDLGVYNAWDYAVGSKDVIVAIVDNGFDTFHPDLYQNVWKNEDEIDGNGIDDDKNGYIDDVWGWNFVFKDTDGNGYISNEEAVGSNNPRPSVLDYNPVALNSMVIHHGTAVAGIIGSVGNNLEEGSGINWNIRMMNLKVVSNDGSGESRGLAQAIRYAVDNGADVINISMVTGLLEENVQDALEYAYKNNVALVAAAGNNARFLNTAPLYPVCTDYVTKVNMVLGVSAINEEHKKAYFSNFGSDCIDITAPGVNVSTTMRYAPRYGLTEKYGGGWDGTSFATPFVSGAIALVKSIQPTWSVDKLYEAVIKTVHRTPPEDPEAYTHLFGAGLLQIDKAVEYAISMLPRIPKGKTLTAVDLSSGFMEFLNTKDGSQDIFSKSIVKNGKSFSSYNDGENKFVVLDKIYSGIRLTVLDNEWKQTNVFDLPLSGVYGVVMADVIGDMSPELIIYPKGKNNTLFYVYSEKGELLKTYTGDFEHTGISLGVLTGINKSEIFVSYKKVENYIVVRFNENFEIEKEISLSFFSTLPNLVAGDIDGDNKDEMIIASGPGQAPFVSIYEQDGTWTRTFYATVPSYTSGFSTTVMDYDGDGEDDIAVYPLSGGKIIVWNSNIKKIAEFNMLEGKASSGIQLFTTK
jgi:hypothetical protein